MERIENLLRDYVQSVNTCNLDLAREIWDREGSISFIHPNGYENSFDEIKEHFYLGVMDKKFSERELKLKDILTKFYGSVALVEFSWDFYAIERETQERFHSEGRETQFLVLRDSGWKISNIHYSKENL